MSDVHVKSFSESPIHLKSNDTPPAPLNIHGEKRKRGPSTTVSIMFMKKSGMESLKLERGDIHSKLQDSSSKSKAIIVDEFKWISCDEGKKTCLVGNIHYPPNRKQNQLDDVQQRKPLLLNSKDVRSYPLPPLQEEDLEGGEASYTDVVDNGFIGIDLEELVPSKLKFPKEKLKTLIAAALMTACFLLTLLSLSLVHEKVPDRSKYGPLPDIFLDSTPPYDWALDVSEYIIMLSMNSVILIAVLHKHRFIVFRRVFTILSLLYLYRAITMYITVLPIASKTYSCSPKSEHLTTVEVMTRMWKLFWGFGLAVSGKHTYCGDFIYSGHTAMLVFCYLVSSEYVSGKFWILNWISWFLACSGVLMLLLSHGHYSIDIVLAYYLTTRLFWMYHTLANNSSLKQYSSGNFFSREWWFLIFLYFEKNVDGPVPNEFQWPLPWPKRWL